MKNKRIFNLLIILTVLCSLVACKNNDEQENPISNSASGEVEISKTDSGNSGDELLSILNDISGDFELELPEEIQKFGTYFNNIKMYLKDADESSYAKYGVSVLLSRLKNESDPFSSISYILQDLNNDGKSELLLYIDNGSADLKNVILSIYALEPDGETCYCILNSQENMIFKLCENNIIQMEFTDIGYISFSQLDENMNLVTLEKTTLSGDNEDILAKYKEANLELKKVK